MERQGNMTPYREIRRYTVMILCVAAAIPVGLIGGGLYLEYRQSIRDDVTTRLVSIVTQHKDSIEGFLSEITKALRVVANTHGRDSLARQEGLRQVFDALQQQYGNPFEDIGVIDAEGRHLAYVGPYDLLGRNYRDTAWFRQTMETNTFVSDVFLGFRQVPHFIIAVKVGKGEEAWIMRATVNAARFGPLVENVRLGRTGEAFIVNREGFYQTQPRSGGKLMDRAPEGYLRLEPFDGVRFHEVQLNFRKLLRAKTWMKNDTWMLVVQQEVADAYAELYHTRNLAILIALAGALLVGGVAFVTTRLLVRRIERSDTEKQLLDEQLIQSSKLASIGEFAAGIAHEINNPLAIIDQEAGWITDILKREKNTHLEELWECKDSLREISDQVARCKGITHKLLGFARKMDSDVKEVGLNALLEDVIGMREREASFNNVRILREYDDTLPDIRSDPSLLRQVFLNLVNNSLDAIGKDGEIRVATESLQEEDAVRIRFTDTGAGILPENLGKIFDPFFTTKPPGKGTGLGLSICHGIIQKLGGSVSVKSHVGQWTTFVLTFPLEYMGKE